MKRDYLKWKELEKKKRLLLKRKATASKMAEPTGFEPATSDVTGRRSNQLNYDSAFQISKFEI